MALALFASIVALTLVWIGRPLLQPDPGAAPPPVAGDPPGEVDKVLAALSEVEYDYQMNKLSDRDYANLRQRYSRRAIALVRQLDGAADPEAAAAEAAAEAAIALAREEVAEG